jgi:hypothetical protein
MVDAHSHLTMPGGAHWIDRALDPTDDLLGHAEHNARLMRQAGAYWARDVGSPSRRDPNDGKERGLAIGLRERWAGKREYPYVRAAGTWVAKKDEPARRPGARTRPMAMSCSPWPCASSTTAPTSSSCTSTDRKSVLRRGRSTRCSPSSRPPAKRGKKVTAHSGNLAGARVGVAAGVHSLEHGFELDADLCRDMAANGTFLVSTLAVMESWLSFGKTTELPRFATDEGRLRIETRRDRARESVRLAHAAGVAICAGTDFGGGSLRANQLAWEVEALVAAGLEPWEAVGAATWRGGEILGESRCRPHQGRRSGRLLPRSRRPVFGSRLPLAGLAYRVGSSQMFGRRALAQASSPSVWSPAGRQLRLPPSKPPGRPSVSVRRRRRAPSTACPT